jgi:hypothetical protein
VLASALLGCGHADAPAQAPVPVAKTASPAPTVLATTKHYLRLLTQAAPPPIDSLTHYHGLVAQPGVLPGRSLLRLATYTVVVQPDSLYPQVMIEPAARTELYSPRPTAAAAPGKKPVQLVLTPRKTNPVLATSLVELVAAFGPWQNDVYLPVEEPLEPDMHTTSLRYRNPVTGLDCRVFVRLRNAPQAATNAVHEIQLTRVRDSP